MLSPRTELPIKGYSSLNLSMSIFSTPPITCLQSSLSSLFWCPATLNSFGMRLTMRVAHFTSHIGKILSSCTQLQVFRIYTEFNITSVHHHHIIWYATNMDNVGSTMRPNNFFTLTFYNSIARTILGTIPQPAIIWDFSNLCHKTFSKWSWFWPSFHIPIIPNISDAGKVGK